MVNTNTVEELVSACFDELQISKRVAPYIQKAEAAGYPQLARMFRAVVASENIREALLRKGMVNHANMEGSYYVCPHCGLIFYRECPDGCPVDETPGAAFLAVH